MVEVKKAIFPLSGDPITNGHINIIERASKWVKEIVVVVLENDTKDSVLGLKERMNITKLCLKSQNIKNVTVDSYSGLLSDYATQIGTFHIIRGIRNAQDLEYEIYLEYGHKRQNPHLEIIYFLAEPQHRTTSSSIARAILKKGGQIKDYIPLQAKQAMEERLMGQYKLIVTGGIACGKSHVTEELVASLAKAGYLVHNIDFDLLVRHIYQKMAAGGYKNLANEIVDYFGKNILVKGRVSQQKVSREVFSPTTPDNKKVSSEEKLHNLLNILRPYINSLYHQELATKKGLIFLNIPLAAESRMLYESNNNVLLVTSTPKTQESRLMSKRGISREEAQLRVQRAGSSQVKKKLIEDIFTQERVGELILHKNEGMTNNSGVDNLKKKILKLFPTLKPIQSRSGKLKK